MDAKIIMGKWPLHVQFIDLKIFGKADGYTEEHNDSLQKSHTKAYRELWRR